MKPILFSTIMVQAILRGEKTQTRRIIKPQPEVDLESGYVFNGKFTCQYDSHNWKDFFIKDWAKYQVGDILWVRETWCKTLIQDEEGEKFMYRVDEDPGCIVKGFGWKPSIFMPKEAARIFLKVTKVRVEKLNDISEEDAFAEGIPRGDKKELKWNRLYPDYLYNKRVVSACLTPQSSYQSLWEKINGKGSWILNPRVWVYEFERIEKP